MDEANKGKQKENRRKGTRQSSPHQHLIPSRVHSSCGLFAPLTAAQTSRALPGPATGEREREKGRRGDLWSK
eukprot:8288757-Prorocentrum_lima.AAC.1